jgi:hypothetical protein
MKVFAFILLSAMLLVLLCPDAEAKLKNKMKMKMFDKTAKSAHGSSIGSDIAGPAQSFRGPVRPGQVAQTQNERGFLSVEEELDDCLATLKSNVREEAEWEEKRDECLAELGPLIEQDKIYEMWRDKNRTLAMDCLIEVTECNDLNEKLVTSSTELDKRQITPDMVNHPYFAREARARRNIVELDADKFLGMAAPADEATRTRRETVQCTLDRCNLLTQEGNYAIQALKKNESWCQREVIHRKESIMAYLRFSILYEQEWNMCKPISAKCRSGARLVRATLTNGDIGEVSYRFDLQQGWLGFAGRFLNINVTEYAEALLQLSSNGDTTYIDEVVGEESSGVVSGPFGEDTPLRRSQSWSQLFELYPEDNNNKVAYAAFPTVVIEDKKRGIEVGPFLDEPVEFLVTATAGIQVFDDNDNFIRLGEAPVIDVQKKRSSKSKRGPNRKDIETCGCIGDPLPHYDSHISYFALHELYEVDADDIDLELIPGAALLTFEELRWTLPYPVGIRSEVADIPSEYPEADKLRRRRR